MKKLIFAILFSLILVSIAYSQTQFAPSYGGPGGTLSDSAPAMDAAANAGILYTSSRGDHVHPIDTSRAPVLIADYQFIPIDAGIDGTTSPSAAVVITSTNKTITRAFSGSTDNDLFFTWQPPSDWDGSTVTFRVIGFVTNGTAPANNETVIFGLAGASVANSESLSSTLGTIVTATFTANATYVQYDRWSTGWSNAVTLTGATAGDTVLLNLLRDTDDTYAQVIGVLGVEIKFGRSLSN